jgi:hypothetical protein
MSRIIDMANVKSEYESSSGWRDNSRVEIPLLDKSASDELIARAVHANFPMGSSWGALRWRAGVYDIAVDREAGVVRFIESWGLAD